MYICLFLQPLEDQFIIGLLVVVAGALVIKDSSFVSFSGNATSSTGVSGSRSAVCAVPLLHPKRDRVNIRDNPSPVSLLILFFILSQPPNLLRNLP